MLLQNIKYDIYDPIEQFLDTRYKFFGLNQFLSIKMITQLEQNQLVLFPNSNMDKEQEFQSFFQNNYTSSNLLLHFMIYSNCNLYTSKVISTYQKNQGAKEIQLLELEEFSICQTINKTINQRLQYDHLQQRVLIFTIPIKIQFHFYRNSKNKVFMIFYTFFHKYSDQLKIYVYFYECFFSLSYYYFNWLFIISNKITKIDKQNFKFIRLKLLQNHINTNYNYLYQYILESQKEIDTSQFRILFKEQSFYVVSQQFQEQIT
ncbi:unnamed protein product [Paramecium primaurelia]|uniref:Transmembrane protein n=1 Tax=Paramecium primaurelia TaxID=5886 RepID=A0A8S1LL76_PARPR|nr:unnamed protein product [Paramecium primaurelia]